MNLEQEKQLVAAEAVKLIKDGMIVGLGSGSTAAFMIKELGKKVENGLNIQGVPSSEETARLAKESGISLLNPEEAAQLDINIDGADEFDSKLRLIKGGGGALLREKIVAHNSKYNVIIADSTKQVQRLGKFKLPVETIPFATASILRELEHMGLKPTLRKKGENVYKTDQNNTIIDLDIYTIENIEDLENTLLHIPGIVETGLFLDSTDLVIFSKEGTLNKIYKKDLVH